MERNDVIKALECCAKNDCTQCRYHRQENECVDLLASQTLSLIKELTEENERLKLRRKNKELFHKWKKIVDETADRFEMLYQDAKASLIADTVRKMHALLHEKKKTIYCDENERLWYDIVEMDDIDQIVDKLLQGELK